MKAKRKSTDDPIRFLHRKGKIDESQAQAGEFFRRDYEATRRPRTGADEPPVSRQPPRPGAPVGHLDASHRLLRLHNHIGKDHYMILVLVAGYGHTLTELEERGCGDMRYLSQTLRDALAGAASFYEQAPAPTTQLVEAGKAIVAEKQR